MLTLDDWHRAWLTPFGRCLFWGGVASGTLLLGGLDEPLVYAFGYCSCTLAIAMLVGWCFRPRLRLTRHVTASAMAGEILQYVVTVENTGRRAARNLTIEERDLPLELRPVEDAARVDILAPGESTQVTLRLRCERRGAYDLTRLQGATTFPTGLSKAGSYTRRSERVLVLPRFEPLQIGNLPKIGRHQPDGIAAARVGESTEFLGTRDWRSGDRLRDIHWRSTARAGKLIVKEFQEEYCERTAIVLDVESNNARDDRRLERAISLAAGVTAGLADGEALIDLFVAGGDVHPLRTGRSTTTLDHVLEILAAVEPGKQLDRELLATTLASEIPRLAAVIFVLTTWDRRRAELIEWTRSWGVAVRVLVAGESRRPAELSEAEFIETAP